MIVSLALPIKGFSVNSTYYASRKIKTAEFRAWEHQVDMLLLHNKELPAMGELFHIHGGSFSVTYIFSYPKPIFYNMHGQVSAKTLDLTNTEKTIQDMLFKAVGADDRYVVKMRSYKIPANEYAIDIILKFNQNIEPDGAVSAAG